MKNTIFISNWLLPRVEEIDKNLTQNDTNESCLARVESKKYEFWDILRSLGSMRGGNSELHTLWY